MSSEPAPWFRTTIFAAAIAFACTSSETRASEPLNLAWSDQEGFLRDKLVPRGTTTMASEVAAILGDAGVHVAWSRLSSDEAVDVVVILTPADPTSFGLPSRTLGAVMGRDGPFQCVYVFYPAVTRLLGTGRPRTTRDFYELGKAIGRVAAHEIVHALTPEQPHTSSGLMMARLTGNALRGRALHLSKSAATAFKVAFAKR